MGRMTLPVMDDQPSWDWGVGQTKWVSGKDLVLMTFGRSISCTSVLQVSFDVKYRKGSNTKTVTIYLPHALHEVYIPCECRKTQTKVITTATQKKGKHQWEFKVKTTKLAKARENAGNQFVRVVVISFSFASDWLEKWHEFSRPITDRNKEN